VRRKPSPEDIELFRRTVGAVKPLTHESRSAGPGRRQSRVRPRRPPSLEALEESLAAAGAVATDDPDVSLGEPLSYRRPGVPDSVIRRLRRGQFAVDGELDLHGLTVAQAKDALRHFLANALARHARCLRIIHGKGLRSGHRGPVLKAFVSSALRQTPSVAAFVSAKPQEGGTGVTLVLLS
jgi:DNA-nicking Smr family endonuclease